MDSSNSLADQIRDWFERSPKAQRAYQRLSADLDAVVNWVDSATSGLLERVTPIIDPSRAGPAAQDGQDAPNGGSTPARPAAQDGQDAPQAEGPAPDTETTKRP
jgi:hypothetical protein